MTQPNPTGGRLAGQLAVVTGGTRGIGRGIVERFVREGAHVVTTARSEASGADLVAAHPDDVTFVVADVAKVADLARLADAVAALGRPVDVVVACAGGGAPTFVTTSTEEEFDAVMALNVKAGVFTVQKLLPHMRDGARVVLIGSIAGNEGGVGNLGYSAAKAAVRSLARSMTNELSPRGIRVNCLSPGPTATEGFERFIDGDEEKRASIVATMPVGHVGSVDEVAAAALFLGTDESSYIAGVELVIDGGLSQV